MNAEQSNTVPTVTHTLHNRVITNMDKYMQQAEKACESNDNYFDAVTRSTNTSHEPATAATLEQDLNVSENKESTSQAALHKTYWSLLKKTLARQLKNLMKVTHQITLIPTQSIWMNCQQQMKKKNPHPKILKSLTQQQNQMTTRKQMLIVLLKIQLFQQTTQLQRCQK